MTDSQIYLIVGVFLMGAVGCAIGANKGNGGAGFLLGMLLGPIGWLLVFIVGASGGKTCSFCAEKIKEEARI